MRPALTLLLLAAVISLALAGCVTADARESGIPDLVTQRANAAGVPPRIAHAVIRHESRYRPDVTGRAGEIGLGQIKCASARGLGYPGPCRALYDPAVNLTWAMRYLRAALDRGGEGCAGVSLYQLGRHASPRCTAYGRAIMGAAK